MESDSNVFAPSSCDFYRDDHDPDRSVACEEAGFSHAMRLGYGAGDAYADMDMPTRSASMGDSLSAFADPYLMHGSYQKHWGHSGEAHSLGAPSSCAEAQIRPDSDNFQYDDTHIRVPRQIDTGVAWDFCSTYFEQLQHITFAPHESKLSLKVTVVCKNEAVSLRAKMFKESDSTHVLELARIKGDLCKFIAVFQQFASAFRDRFPCTIIGLSTNVALLPPPEDGDFTIGRADVDPLLSFFDSQFEQDHVEGLQLLAQFAQDETDARQLLAKALFEEPEQADIASKIVGYLQADNPEAAYAVCSTLVHLTQCPPDCEILVAFGIHYHLLSLIEAGAQAPSVLQRAAWALRNMQVSPKVQTILSERSAKDNWLRCLSSAF
mmetsp:Transcript_14015/g.31041  ORF Transcript_14015/g.31041 Transcript_14015/m.31041 type:complete len:379 (+) Transcript_14015:162-1298(+)